MNRLESINKGLSIHLDNTSEEILRKIYQYTLDFSTQEGKLVSDKAAESIILKLRNSDFITQDDIKYIQDQVERHDEIYFDLDDEGKEEEATEEFVKARAFAAVLYLVQYKETQDLLLLKEAIYEASVLLEDSTPYFEAIDRLMDN